MYCLIEKEVVLENRRDRSPYFTNLELYQILDILIFTKDARVLPFNECPSYKYISTVFYNIFPLIHKILYPELKED